MVLRINKDLSKMELGINSMKVFAGTTPAELIPNYYFAHNFAKLVNNEIQI